MHTQPPYHRPWDPERGAHPQGWTLGPWQGRPPPGLDSGTSRRDTHPQSWTLGPREGRPPPGLDSGTSPRDTHPQSWTLGPREGHPPPGLDPGLAPRGPALSCLHGHRGAHAASKQRCRKVLIRRADPWTRQGKADSRGHSPVLRFQREKE